MAQVHQFLTEVPRFPGFLKIRCQASAAAGLEKPPLSGDRWLSAGDPNRLLPGRLVRPVAQLYQLAVGSVVKWG
jgi:hypothetical protein